MAGTRRRKLFEKGRVERTDHRHSAEIIAGCAIGGRPAEEVCVSEMSAHGCRARLPSLGVTKSVGVVLRFGAEEPVTGRLKWARQGYVGVAFDAPLPGEVLARLNAAAPSVAVLPPKRRRSL